MSLLFMVDTDEACRKAGISKWSWTTDFVALNTPVQTVIHCTRLSEQNLFEGILFVNICQILIFFFLY